MSATTRQMMTASLKLDDLTVTVDNNIVVKNVSLEIIPGTTHIMMGPNGSGKSSLACALMGHPSYHITTGSITLDGVDVTRSSPDERARRGIFLALQQPLELPGVRVFTFLQEIYRAVMGTCPPPAEFHTLATSIMSEVGLDASFIDRSVNEGFSGGEKKRFEIVQFLLLNPAIAVFDEIDSGLDVDALRAVAHAITNARAANPALALVIITHHHRILDYLCPDFVHILSKGRVLVSGGRELAHTIEQEGYHAIGTTQT